MQTFAHYSDAKATAERIVRDLANGSQAAALNAMQFSPQMPELTLRNYPQKMP